jgi:parvulin-like peptidyl-prolyl isomerase
MLVAALLQVSTLFQPLHLEPRPPELRALRHVVIAFAGAEQAPPGLARTKEEAARLAADLATRLRAGADFAAAVREHSAAPDARTGGVLGSFAPGALARELDTFLFAAEPGAVGEPLLLPDGWHVPQRIDAYAAVLEIRIDCPETDAAAKQRIDRLAAELTMGGDFAALAKEHSSDRVAAERGGQRAIYERGPRDVLLKAAAFELPIGGVSWPIRSPVAWHILKRVPLAEVDPALRENNWVRVRAILVQHEKAVGADPATARTQTAARAIADDLLARAQKGEEFAKLAKETNDDPGGKERGGELGWVHRGAPALSRALAQAFLMKRGETQLQDTAFGYVVLQRVE